MFKFLRLKITVIIIIVLTILFILVRPYYLFLTQTLNISPLKVLFSGDILKTFDNQVNILILGIAGGEYDGPNLSDSIITANYNFKTNQLTTISLPRDIWSATLKDKINSAYAYGEAKQIGGGFKLAKAEIGSVVNLPIQYTILIDFDEFQKVIDDLNGLDIDVENSFVDKEYPIAGREDDLCGGADPDYSCRYETVSFKKGLQHMNGEIALKYVRSRHAVGQEGTDFARNKRQQRVIESIKNKLFIEVKKHDLKKLTQLYQSIDKLLKRDISNQQLAIIAKNILFSRGYKQTAAALSEDLFYVPQYSKYNGHYVLMPLNDNFSLIHDFVKCSLNTNSSLCNIKK